VFLHELFSVGSQDYWNIIIGCLCNSLEGSAVGYILVTVWNMIWNQEYNWKYMYVYLSWHFAQVHLNSPRSYRLIAISLWVITVRALMLFILWIFGYNWIFACDSVGRMCICFFGCSWYNFLLLVILYSCGRRDCYRSIMETLDYLLSTGQQFPQAPSVPRVPGPLPVHDPGRLSGAEAEKYVSTLVLTVLYDERFGHYSSSIGDVNCQWSVRMVLADNYGPASAHACFVFIYSYSILFILRM